jgi:hypothetical protein
MIEIDKKSMPIIIKKGKQNFFGSLEVTSRGFTFWIKDTKEGSFHWIIDASLFFEKGYFTIADNTHWKVGLKKVGKKNEGKVNFEIYKEKKR